MQKENPGYYAIIPAHVRYAKITPGAKLLYGELTALTNKEGYCWATNAYFAELYSVSADTVSRWVKELKENNFISSELVYKENSKEIASRYLRICGEVPVKTPGGTRKNMTTPTSENVVDNNTSNNNTLNSTFNIADKSAGSSQLVAEVIKEMESIDPKNKMYYGNKTQRAAADFLISSYGYENVIAMIRAIPELKSRVAYMPSVTTPCELRDKWQKIGDAIGREKVNKKNDIISNLQSVIW